MNISAFTSNNEVFSLCEFTSISAFDTDLWDQSALLPFRGDIFTVKQDCSAHLCRIENLLPYDDLS